METLDMQTLDQEVKRDFLGYDEEGYDEEGYDYGGYDAAGVDWNGNDRNGRPLFTHEEMVTATLAAAADHLWIPDNVPLTLIMDLLGVPSAAGGLLNVRLPILESLGNGSRSPEWMRAEWDALVVLSLRTGGFSLTGHAGYAIRGVYTRHTSAWGPSSPRYSPDRRGRAYPFYLALLEACSDAASRKNSGEGYLILREPNGLHQELVVKVYGSYEECWVPLLTHETDTQWKPGPIFRYSGERVHRDLRIYQTLASCEKLPGMAQQCVSELAEHLKEDPAFVGDVECTDEEAPVIFDTDEIPTCALSIGEEGGFKFRGRTGGGHWYNFAYDPSEGEYLEIMGDFLGNGFWSGFWHNLIWHAKAASLELQVLYTSKQDALIEAAADADEIRSNSLPQIEGWAPEEYR